MSSSIYLTVISPVLEVTLAGRADAAPWQSALQQEGLTPHLTDGKAELLISTVDSTYWGIRFRELSVSVRTGENDYFLAHAFNALRPFALVERWLFRTPYDYARLVVEPRQVIAQRRGVTVFHAQQSAGVPCTRRSVEDFALRILLPKALRRRPDTPHYFYARLQGDTETYPASLTTFALAPAAPGDVFALLRESRFTPETWHVRPQATHSKSKTYLMDKAK